MLPENSKLKGSQKVELENTVSAAQMRELKEQSQLLKPAVIIGQSGLSDIVIQEIERALGEHELIKVRLTDDDSEVRAAIAQDICRATQAILVQTIGQVITIYRKNLEEG